MRKASRHYPLLLFICRYLCCGLCAVRSRFAQSDTIVRSTLIAVRVERLGRCDLELAANKQFLILELITKTD